ncbi:MAG: prepilin-type N-terminal cleavage/methylation domain-containing protein [Verrucomicrobia bacterium]|nr:prepilin-type N-terminal cleavage/methylation domain-containing protein [Verrucomicrobiota bacterium]
MNTKRRGGFTLMELLVVMGIILLLAALLTPVVTQVLERGRRTYCLNNVKMIATAATLLFAESEPELPYRGSASGDWGAAAAQLIQYLDENTAAFHCPSNKKKDFTYTFVNSKGDTVSDYTNYEMNGYLCSYGSSIRMDRCITYPSESAYTYDVPYTGDSSPHETGANIGYLDGHAEWLSLEKMALDGAEVDKFFCWGHEFCKGTAGCVN